jgi:hypothetical protein
MDGNHATIEKRGSGNLTLNGDSQFVGDQITFVVTEGTLSINGNVRTTNGGDVEVNGGTFKGVGTVGNLTTTGGTLAPGNSPGSLAVSSLTLDATNTLEVELNGSVAGTSYDQIVASGAVDLGSATLSVKLGFTPTVGQVFTIITGSPVAGTFKNLPNGSTIVVDGSAFRVNYNGTNVTLTYLGGAQAAALADTGTNTVMIALSSILLISFAVILLSHRRALLSPKN